MLGHDAAEGGFVWPRGRLPETSDTSSYLFTLKTTRQCLKPVVFRQLAKNVAAIWQRFLQTAASSSPLGMNSRDAGKELPRIHPIASAIRIYRLQHRTVLVHPLHFFFTNDQPCPKEVTPIYCVFEIKLTSQREAHFHSQVTRCAVFPCR